MDIEKIISEDTIPVDVDKLELPENMQEQTTTPPPSGGSGSDEPKQETTRLSLEQLSGMIIGAFDVVNKMMFRRFEPAFDASLTPDEKKVINEPLKLVLQSYDIEVTPPVALMIAVAGVEVCKFRQMKMFQAERMKNIRFIKELADIEEEQRYYTPEDVQQAEQAEQQNYSENDINQAEEQEQKNYSENA